MSTGRDKHLASISRKISRPVMPLFAVSGAMVAILLAYLSFDYVAMRASPCEAIFRQASIGLSAKIRFLKAEGHIAIGQEELVELNERAQMAALNLKTCCTVLDAGKLNPEQFLQCKAKARAYEAKLDDISETVEIIAPGIKSAPIQKDNSGDASSVPAAEMKSKISEKVQAAHDISKEFNREIVEVRNMQALKTMELQPPTEVEVSAQEKEPNNDGLNTNAIPLGNWISASIGDGKDADVFSFKTPETYRDWITIKLDNRSTTLEPRIELFNSDKASLGYRHSTTPGANLEYRFLSKPQSQFQVRVSNYYGESSGGYLLRVIANKAYDRYEPNDDQLNARAISADASVQAEIMDGKDHDFFRFDTPEWATSLQVQLVNKSTTLRPRIDIYGEDKAHITHKYNQTASADLMFTLPVDKWKAFRVQVSDYYGDAGGAYNLILTYKK